MCHSADPPRGCARQVIGITLETRPDFITRAEIKRFRRYGCTRVQVPASALPAKCSAVLPAPSWSATFARCSISIRTTASCPCQARSPCPRASPPQRAPPAAAPTPTPYPISHLCCWPCLWPWPLALPLPLHSRLCRAHSSPPLPSVWSLRAALCMAVYVCVVLAYGGVRLWCLRATYPGFGGIGFRI